MSRGKRIITECLVCGHKQGGWSAIDGRTCEKCGGYIVPLKLAGEQYKKDGVSNEN